MAAVAVQRAVSVIARCGVFDAYAIARVEFAHCAEAPNGVLDKSGKMLRKVCIELRRIDFERDSSKQRFAAVLGVTRRSINMLGVEPALDAGAMQPCMDERIDCDHGRTGGEPTLPGGIGGKQQARQRHVQHFVGDAVNMTHRLDHRLCQRLSAIWTVDDVGAFERLVEPPHEIAIGHVPEKQEQAVCCLVQTTMPQIMLGQRTTAKQLWLSARLGLLTVFAVVEVPVAFEFVARLLRQGPSNVRRGQPAVLFHVTVGNAISDACKCKCRVEPAEQRIVIVRLNGDMYVVMRELFLRFVDDP